MYPDAEGNGSLPATPGYGGFDASKVPEANIPKQDPTIDELMQTLKHYAE